MYALLSIVELLRHAARAVADRQLASPSRRSRAGSCETGAARSRRPSSPPGSASDGRRARRPGFAFPRWAEALLRDPVAVGGQVRGLPAALGVVELRCLLPSAMPGSTGLGGGEAATATAPARTRTSRPLRAMTRMPWERYGSAGVAFDGRSDERQRRPLAAVAARALAQARARRTRRRPRRPRARAGRRRRARAAAAPAKPVRGDVQQQRAQEVGEHGRRRRRRAVAQQVARGGPRRRRR